MIKSGVPQRDLSTIRQRYHGQAEREWQRLAASPITRIEYLINCHCLAAYLPPTGLILDAGCGPGRYTLHLAAHGYRVVMFDLVREMLALGQRKVQEAGYTARCAAAIEGNIAALPFAEDSFDAAISLGAPLSHLTDVHARTEAVIALARTLRPGGRLLLTGITRLATYRGIVFWMDEDFFTQWLDAEARDPGCFDGSQRWYTFAPGELETLAEGAGLRIVDRVGCEGLASYLPLAHLEQVEADPVRWPLWRDLLLETCNEPTIIGISNHLLIVAEKP